MRRLLGLVVAVALLAGAQSTWAEQASGYVFADKNGNGVRDAGEKGLSGVLVSNGEEVVPTDRTGHYAISVTDDTVLFVIKPAGWMTPVGPGNNVPKFYYLHKPKGSPTTTKYAGVAPTGPLPASVDFPLHKQKERDQFRVVCMGDTQTADLQDVRFMAHDVVEELVGVDAAFGITLGDNVNNDLTTFEPLLQAMSQIGIPWRYVPGNHDHNHDAPTTEQSTEGFERVFGPPWYSFNYGKVHFIVLNDVRHDANKSAYHGGLGARQLAFVKNDLSHVNPRQLVVLMMHIPITSQEDAKPLYALLKDFPHTFSLSAHTHSQRHVFVDRSQGWLQDTPHHHLNHGTACGSWWGGSPDELGLPPSQMSDGTPNGYSFITFKGSGYEVEYKAARQPAGYQMNVWLPETVAADKAGQTTAIANVFAGSEKSRVEMRVDGAKDWTPMERFTGKEPFLVEAFARQEAFVAKLAKVQGVKEISKDFAKKMEDEFGDTFRPLAKPSDTPHLWRANLTPGLGVGDHTLEVRTTDMFGHTYSAKRIFAVEAGH